MNPVRDFWNRILTWLQPRDNRIGGHVGAGMYITHETALQHANVWACVKVISETIATLGWNITKENNDGTKQRITGTPVDWLLNMQANPEMTAFVWRELAIADALLTGNHYSEIERDVMGRPLWLWPIPWSYVRPTRDEAGALKYYVMGGNMRAPIYIDPANMLHVHGLGWDGVSGYSVITMARRTIGTGLAMDEFGANFYANNTQPGLVVKHPKALSEPARENLKKSLDERKGAGASWKTIVLEEGMTLEPPSMTMVDAEFMAARKMQIQDVCRIFRVPPHKVQDLERSTNNNIEHQSIEFVQDTVLPWCRRLEQEVDIKLFGRAARGKLHTRLNVDTLLRGDIVSRYTAYKMGRDGGWLSPNDVRRLENMNPIEKGGDEYMRPMNFVPLGTEAPTPNAAPAAASGAGGPTGDDPTGPADPATDPVPQNAARQVIDLTKRTNSRG